jgi:acyl-CoA synthetase (AMP-forming)/AMP-acid ligase II
VGVEAAVTPLAEVLGHLAATRPSEPAIISASGESLSYERLLEELARFRTLLRRNRIGPYDTVAVSVRNGVPAALSTLGTMTSAVALPINPSWTEAEARALFATARPHALVTDGHAHGVETAAVAEGIRVLEVPRRGDRAHDGGATGDEPVTESTADALIVPTSGTESAPKLVRLTHGNVSYAAALVGASLDIDQRDRLASVMPFFHTHGLIGGLCAALASGSSVVCFEGFVPTLSRAMHQHECTWLTAAPPIHNALLTHARLSRRMVRPTGLRFIRTTSAAMPKHVAEALEESFEVPVVEAYALTEMPGQITTNTPGFKSRRLGSVGKAIGCAVALVDADLTVVKPGATGRIAITGPHLTPGYVNATTNAFTDGWLVTGDEARADDDGVFYLIGRASETINRGGEKIAPAEVDDVVLRHPEVVDAAAFRIGHPSLGDDIALVVVLVAGSSAGKRDIQAYLREHLSDFKVPRRIWFTTSVPRSATGKPQRNVLTSAFSRPT